MSAATKLFIYGNPRKIFVQSRHYGDGGYGDVMYSGADYQRFIYYIRVDDNADVRFVCDFGLVADIGQGTAKRGCEIK